MHAPRARTTVRLVRFLFALFLLASATQPAVSNAQPSPRSQLGLEPPDTFRLLAYTLRLLPIPVPVGAQGAGDAEMLYRLELVQACVDATTDRSERYICAKIPRYESLYRIDVGRCEVVGKAGDLTAWQIVPRSKEERARLCVSLLEDAKVAIERIRESRRACWRLPKQDQLALYARGSCDSEEGRRLSRTRFPTDAEVKRIESEW